MDIKNTYSKVKADNEKQISVWLFYIIRPFSFYITLVFTRIKVSANFASILGLFMGLISCFFFITGIYINQIIGALLFNFFLVLDCVDGNIARLGGSYPKGALLDAFIGDIISILIFPSIGIGIISWSRDVDLIFISNNIIKYLPVICSILLSIILIQNNILSIRYKTLCGKYSLEPTIPFGKSKILLKFLLIIVRNLYGLMSLGILLLVFSILNLLSQLILVLLMIYFSVFLFFTYTYIIKQLNTLPH